MYIKNIEKCHNIIPNKFELILLANQRICEINNTSISKLDNVANNKNITTAFAEIAQGKIGFNELKNRLLKAYGNNKNAISSAKVMRDLSEKELGHLQQVAVPSVDDRYDEINENPDLLPLSDYEPNSFSDEEFSSVEDHEQE